MHRIDSSTSAPSLPTAAPVGSPGFFAAGNPSAGIPFTQTTNDWANAVQEEIVHCIIGAGLTLDKADDGQLLTAVQSIATSAANSAMLAGFYRFLTGTGGGGYFFERFPDGTIIQANTGISVTGNADSINFPLSFPNNCWTVIAEESAPAGWVNCTTPTIFGTQVLTPTGFSLYIARWNGSAMVPGNGVSYRFLALGY